ncbi:MAG TPA: exodeoxyribonuclease VII large subunit [Bacilli bacterium]|nr:exodeoxyribonuclease VII large subunit [Bacilli bacterium]HPS18707.1 exodeoxyribonuclease VII large subunit [Bacilli bacterium]
MNYERTIYSVNDINQYVKSVLSQDAGLKYILVKGEISNFKNGAAGHLYFSLKDDKSLIGAVMFSSSAQRLNFVPKNGDEVIVLASLDVYAVKGTYQLLCYEMEQVGAGAILIELEKLKKKLQSEGLFDASRKREINIYPSSIGVITAPNSAAIKDILTNIKRRYPIADIYVFYCSVQGDNAVKEILKAFEESQKYPLDTLIIGRGGGSSEDLSAFNDEKIVRAVANSRMPVISAVGHEIDTTLVDYVADKRASTPTGAAELATVDRREIEQEFENHLENMKMAIVEKLNDMRENIIDTSEELKDVLNDKLTYLKQEIKWRKEQLTALNPTSILNRGYSITMDQNGQVVDDVSKVKPDEKITTIVRNGRIISTVNQSEEVENERNKN